MSGGNKILLISMSHINKYIINWIFFCYLFVHVFLQDFTSTTIYIVVQYIFDVVISIFLICRYPFYGIYLLPFFVLSITYFMVQIFQQENVHVFVKLLPPILLAYQGYKKNINPLVPYAFFCLLSVVYLYLYFISI